MVPHLIFLALAVFLSPLAAGAAWAQDLRIVTYNVESDSDTTSVEVAKDIREIGSADIWALQEVDGFRSIFPLREAMNTDGRDMWFELGLSGGSDRLAIVYDRNRFEAFGEPEELIEVGGSRRPLRLKLIDKQTRMAFNVISVHLNRGNEETRREQARNLRRWADEAGEPSIILGDFNFDLEVDDWQAGSLVGNPAYHLFTRAPSPFVWAQHSPMVKTQCSPRYNSVLDFIFLTGAARSWDVQTTAFFHDDPAYCANESAGGADHLPLVASIAYSNADAVTGENAAILREIERIRQQLDDLEQMVRAQ